MKQPLAERMRPRSLDDVLGQDHLSAPDSLFRKSLRSEQARSFILWGPPGTGKTTIAACAAQEMGLPFYNLSAVHSGVKDIKKVLEIAEKTSTPTALFLDEIHHFNKSQQDILLTPIEQGHIILIGSTTENPSFEINKALLSRCHVFTLNALSDNALAQLLQKTLTTDELLRAKNIRVKNPATLIRASAGDARRMLGLVERLSASGTHEITDEDIAAHAQFAGGYDKHGEQHYDTISAFIKSIRGSDPNAAVYWLARMLHGGENPLFIARRLLILAAEDIGNANPNALLLANTTFDAVHKLGLPEARIPLSQCAIYLACSQKSNSAYMAINKAQKMVAENPHSDDIPKDIRNAPTTLMKNLDYGKNYLYPHDYEGNFVAQEYMPLAFSNTIFYEPADNSKERAMKEDLKKKWAGKYRYE